MKPLYYKFKDSLIVFVNGKTITIHSSDVRYNKVFAALSEERHSDIPKLADNENAEAIRSLLKIRTKKEHVS